MADQIYIGNFRKGMQTMPLAYNLDNDAFPSLFNMYVWRGRAKRKRGTSYLGQLRRQLSLSDTPSNFQQQSFALLLGNGNLLNNASFDILASEPGATIVPGTINLLVTGDTYTDPDMDGFLRKNGVVDHSNAINYATGIIALFGKFASTVTGTYSYYPGLPVMGLRDFTSSTDTALIPLLLAFDTTYSYQINQAASPNSFYNVNFYKSSQNPFVWSAPDSQLFWTTNYQGALWATNNKSGFHVMKATVTGGADDLWTFDLTDAGFGEANLVVGDKLFFNEFIPAPPEPQIADIIEIEPNKKIGGGKDKNQTRITTKAANNFAVGDQVTISGVQGMTQINDKTYNISAVASPKFTIDLNSTGFDKYSKGGQAEVVPDEDTEEVNGTTGTVEVVNGAGSYDVRFEYDITVANEGIVQLLTQSLDGQDGIKWYDGDPTNKNGIPNNTGLGWVNYMPPLTDLTVSIDNLTSDKWYLVGCLGMLPFKDRLLFFSPTIQSVNHAPITLIDTVLWTWNGTAYYADPTPVNQTFDVTAVFVDQIGKGGYLPAGISKPIITFGNNEDALIIGFGGGLGRKTRFSYTGNDIQPFLFYDINSQLPSTSTFSSVNLDKGMIDIGVLGINITDQQSCQRIDLDIPDFVFNIKGVDNGFQRVNAIQDYLNEWIYFSYPLSTSAVVYPTQTFLFNYRDNTWGILYENYTAHGYYRPQQKYTWLTHPKCKNSPWSAWNIPWNSGLNAAVIPKVIAGNPQGFVLYLGEGTSEDRSGTIQAISNSGGALKITSINHCVAANNQTTQEGDFLLLQGLLATGVGETITALNGKIGKVIRVIDKDNFVLDLLFPTVGTYVGNGTFSRLSQPWLQTKQFNPYWEQGRAVRLGPQRYLMKFTDNAQVTINLYLSQNPDESFNDPTINVPQNSLIYSQVLFTCPELSSTVLTPPITAPNNNLQMPGGEGQQYIWHRMSTSLIGDSVQIGITLSDTQMRNLDFATAEVELTAMNLQVSPSRILA